MNVKWFFLIALISLPLLSLTIYSQQSVLPNDDIFNPEIVGQIILDVEESDIEFMYSNPYSNNEHPISPLIIINETFSDTIFDATIRPRGNTSRNQQKKSWKISFNSIESGKKYKGLEKMNLNGEVNDVSVMRSHICWYTLNKLGLPGARTSYYYLATPENAVGLYLNVEHIDEEFLRKRFGNNDGAFFKCTFPSDLNWLGDNVNSYMDLGYESKQGDTNAAFQELVDFIEILNSADGSDFECELESIFNVDAFLKYCAFDVASGNWDGPHYNRNNFYLYRNEDSHQFEYISYDLDNTLGIDWLNRDWSDRSIYEWSQTNNPRPLYNQIIAHEKYRDRFSFYLNQILTEIWKEETFLPLLMDIHQQISFYVESDPFYPFAFGFDFEDFEESLLEGYGDPHLPYGIWEFIERRRESALDELELNDIYPVLTYPVVKGELLNQPVTFSVVAEDESNENLDVQLHYSINGGAESQLTLLDDGMDADQRNMDLRFSASIEFGEAETFVEYYFTAVDENGQEERTPCSGYFELELQERSTLPLFINEIAANGSAQREDDAGENEDYIELYNAGSESISLAGKFLSDERNNPSKFALPNVEIEEGSFLTIWADEDQEQGEFHANFRLNNNGERIQLSIENNGEYLPIDVMDFQVQTSGNSFGHFPNGSSFCRNMTPSPSASNNGEMVGLETQNSIEHESLKMVNPVYSNIELLTPFTEEIEFAIYDLFGKKLIAGELAREENKIAVLPLASGMYLLKIKADKGISSALFLKK